MLSLKYNKIILKNIKSYNSSLIFLRPRRASQVVFSLFYKQLPKPGDLVFVLYLTDGFILRTFFGLCVATHLGTLSALKSSTFTVLSTINGIKQTFFFLSPLVLLVKCDDISFSHYFGVKFEGLGTL